MSVTASSSASSAASRARRCSSLGNKRRGLIVDRVKRLDAVAPILRRTSRSLRLSSSSSFPSSALSKRRRVFLPRLGEAISLSSRHQWLYRDLQNIDKTLIIAHSFLHDFLLLRCGFVLASLVRLCSISAEEWISLVFIQSRHLVLGISVDFNFA